MARRRIVQRQVLYLGEINDSQEASWRKTIEVFEKGKARHHQMMLFPHDRPLPSEEAKAIAVNLNELRLERPRQWGACWLSCLLWDQLKLDDFWKERLPPSREGTRWKHVFQTLVTYRLIDPGSEWRLHRLWYEKSAMGDLLGEDFGLVQKDKLYRCMDKLLSHKKALFSFLQERWREMFDAKFDILFYDLTSTYFESNPPKGDKRQFGYSRDKRSDCLQVVIALIVTPQGFPLAYEVLPGNTQDKTTLKSFLEKIEMQYGQANRTWIMDRGIPTEEILGEMRESESPIYYLVGTPKGRLTQFEKKFLELPWKKARESVRVKLLQEDQELYVLVESKDRVQKERSMRERRLKKLTDRLEELQKQKLTRDDLLMKVGAAKKEAGRAFSLITLKLPERDQPVNAETFSYAINQEKLDVVVNREGRYLLRSNLVGEDPESLWEKYILLTEVEQAFKDLKGDLSLRPIHHQKEERIEAHIFVAFQSYCLFVTLKQRLKALAPGLTPRSVLDKLGELQMIDVHLPTTDGRCITLSRYTQPTRDHQILLSQMRLHLPNQPPPRISVKGRMID